MPYKQEFTVIPGTRFISASVISRSNPLYNRGLLVKCVTLNGVMSNGVTRDFHLYSFFSFLFLFSFNFLFLPKISFVWSFHFSPESVE